MKRPFVVAVVELEIDPLRINMNRSTRVSFSEFLKSHAFPQSHRALVFDQDNCHEDDWTCHRCDAFLDSAYELQCCGALHCQECSHSLYCDQCVQFTTMEQEHHERQQQIQTWNHFHCPHINDLGEKCDFCNATLMEMERHLSHCPFLSKQTRCEHCDKLLPRNQIERHQQTDCMHILIDCPHKAWTECNARLSRMEMNSIHSRNFELHANLAFKLVSRLQSQIQAQRTPLEERQQPPPKESPFDRLLCQVAEAKEKRKFKSLTQ